MFGITDLLMYFVAVLIVIVLPGPNSLYCLTTATTHGKRAGFLAAAGIVVGDSVLIVATVLGAGTLLKLYPSIFDVIKLIGGAYLFYLGIRLLLGAYGHYQQYQQPPKNPITTPTHTTQHNYFYRALMLSLTNPKAIMFFLSFFVPFVEPNYPKPFISFLVLGLILQAVSGSYLTILILVGRHLVAKFTNKPWLSMTGMTVVGMIFVAFAINLWTSQL